MYYAYGQTRNLSRGTRILSLEIFLKRHEHIKVTFASDSAFKDYKSIRLRGFEVGFVQSSAKSVCDVDVKKDNHLTQLFLSQGSTLNMGSINHQKVDLILPNPHKSEFSGQ